jgi:hypothetical protein
VIDRDATSSRRTPAVVLAISVTNVSMPRTNDDHYPRCEFDLSGSRTKSNGHAILNAWCNKMLQVIALENL